MKEGKEELEEGRVGLLHKAADSIRRGLAVKDPFWSILRPF